MRRTRIEHILSALPPLTTEERTFGIGSFVPEADMGFPFIAVLVPGAMRRRGRREELERL